MDLAGRTAVVIGGGSGIGRGIALGLAAEGCRVAVADIDGASADAVAAELTASGAIAIADVSDATSRESLEDLALRAAGELGPIGLLVCTVGAIVDRRLDAATEADWAWIVEFNLMATVQTVDVFLPYLRAAATPTHIVCTSSMAGLLALGPERVGGFFNGLYTTTKHALIGYCAMLRAELAPEGIGVSVLCPGAVEGNLARTSARNRPDRFGGTMEFRGASGMPPGSMPGEAVGPIVVRGIRADRLHIFTHPETVALVQARHDEMLEDFAFYAGG